MKVFISHAILDQQLATRIKKLLSDVSLGLIEPWLSSSLDGLRPGDVLWDEIHEQLKNANRIITILTPNSYLRPWLLYESGYVAGHRGAQVIPLLCGITKAELPAPLSAYIVYSLENINELNRLLFQLLSEVVPYPNQELIKSQVERLQAEFPSLLVVPPQPVDRPNEQNYLEALGIKFLDKLKASEVFHRKLADPNIRKVTIITYTNEVEAGSINHYRVKGKKDISIYKRSLFADLSEQQKYNVCRIGSGSTVKKWDKSRISLHSSKVLEEEFKDNPDVTIKEYFYDSPPTKRAYIFDDQEAIIAHYEKVDDPLVVGGSIYKGMNNSQSLWLSNKSEIGRYLINELLNYTKSLQPCTHTCKEEIGAIEKKEYWQQKIKKPCLFLKAVFLDMDGVLYDSLPAYVKAWQGGFQEIGINFPEAEVYRQEGRPGRATVEAYLASKKILNVHDDQINLILKKKAEILDEIGTPPIQHGAKELVGAIGSSNLQIWVVTGSTRPGIKEQLEKDFSGFICANNVITGRDYHKGKPHPDPYQIAAAKAGINPEQAVIVENAPLGIEAADKSGSFCIAVNTGILNDSELEEAGARVIFRDCMSLANVWPEIVKTLTC